jgi:hypothetical protein
MGWVDLRSPPAAGGRGRIATIELDNYDASELLDLLKAGLALLASQGCALVAHVACTACEGTGNQWRPDVQGGLMHFVGSVKHRFVCWKPGAGAICVMGVMILVVSFVSPMIILIESPYTAG